MIGTHNRPYRNLIRNLEKDLENSGIKTKHDLHFAINEMQNEIALMKSRTKT